MSPDPHRPCRLRVAASLLAALATSASLAGGARQDNRLLFADDFERDLSRWEIAGAPSVRTADSGDPLHRRVLVLEPGGDVYALIRGSERWGRVRIDGEVLFPTDIDNYLGVVYAFGRQNGRADFGVVYIKGNDSYLQANPHRDFNVGRTLYPEHHAPLAGAAAIETGRWQRFRVEVYGATCHFYVGDAATPQLTFPHFERSSGAIGLQPRSVGGTVWVDNVRVSAIDRLSYDGPPIPNPRYAPEALLTEWEAAGPFDRTRDRLAERPDDAAGAWRPFATDARGAVVTGRVVDYHGPRTVGYFRTRVSSPSAGPARLELSTVDDLAVWVNGRFHWFIPRQAAAWYDFWSNPAHAARAIPIQLRAGPNDLVLRVRGGVYASGGFFARVVPGEAAKIGDGSGRSAVW